MLKLGVAGTGYFILGPDGKISYADDTSIPPSPFTAPFIDELPLPGLVQQVAPFPFELPEQYRQRWVNADTDFFKIASETRFVKFHSRLPLTLIWGYRDLSPDAEPTVGAGSLQPLPYNVLGPTLVQLFGKLAPPRPDVDPVTGECMCGGMLSTPFPIGGGILVRHVNCLPKDHRGFGVPRTTVHLHGGHHLARSDGFPENIENRPGNNGNADTPDGFPCFIVMEPRGFVPPPDEPVCATPTPSVSEMCPDGQHVSDRQVLDYYYPILDPGCLDRLEKKCDEETDATERPSTQWYHDHLLDFTGPNAYRGLAGFVLCFDELDSNDENDPRNEEGVPGVRYPRPLRLPSAPFDIALAIQDKRFAADGSLVFSTFDHDGFLGDKFMMNGAIQPYLRVKRRKYRFRFLNGSNARIYQMFLTDGSGTKYTMDMIATEGGLLSAPFRGITSFMIAMAERVEVVIDFGHPMFDAIAASSQPFLYIENRLAQTDGRKPDGLASSGPRILQFIIDGVDRFPDNSQVPDVLRPFAAISQTEIDAAYRNLRTFRFDRSHGGWTINGDFVDIERPIARPKRNVPEIWRLVNDSGGWWHPIHIHSEFFRVIRRNGRTPNIPAAPARSWVPGFERDGFVKKDTILLRDNENVDVFLRFRDHLGPFVFHCHNMEHEDMAMMGRFDVVP